MLTHRDRREIEHRFAYDGENRVTQRIRDGLRIETLEYDDAGRVEKRIDARDEQTAYTYDAAGSVLTETRPLGFVQRWTYWPWGGVETQTDADGITTRFNYDARRRLRQQTEPGGRITEHRYDGVDNRVRTTRPGGAEWNFEYNADKQLTAVISAERHRTEYAYDKSGNRVRVEDAEDVLTTTVFDARNRATAIDHPIGGDEGFEYNGAGELVLHTDRSGQRIEIERDGLGRVTERRYGSAQAGEVNREAFTLNGDGQATALSQYGEVGGRITCAASPIARAGLCSETDRFN